MDSRLRGNDGGEEAATSTACTRLQTRKSSPAFPGNLRGKCSTASKSGEVLPSYFFFISISRKIIGVKISCIARLILPPGTTMMFGRDIQESCSIDSR
jgi:hypothetical protein